MGIRSKLKFKDMSNVEFNLLTTHYKYYHHRIVENISIQSSTLKKCMSNNSSSPVMFDVHIFSLIYGFITSAGITNILHWPLSLKFHNSIPLLPFKMKQLYYAPISESGTSEESQNLYLSRSYVNLMYIYMFVVQFITPKWIGNYVLPIISAVAIIRI